MNTRPPRVRQPGLGLTATLLACLALLTATTPSQPTQAAALAQSTAIYLPLLNTAGAAGGTDSGFRPANHGFSFENYGGDSGYTNLSSAELVRLFGAEVCASEVVDGSCTLTPPAEQWMSQQNNDMNGGHCEGFAVLSLLFYGKTLDPADFGASSVPELTIQDNAKLQREIAYWFTTQSTQPAAEAIIKGAPLEIVDTLRAAYQSGKVAEYALGFYKRDGSGGHAVTPIAVEERGDNRVAILIYDNNYPGNLREIVVDTARNVWSYQGSTNPVEPADEYEGDATSLSLELAPIPPRVPQQLCPFCEQAPAPALQQTVRYNEVYLDGDADLLITEDQGGRAIGYRGGEFVNEISGASARSTKFLMPIWANSDEPIYQLPTTVDFTISIDGSGLDAPSSSEVSMIGPGYVLEINDITLEAGQVDELNVSANGTQLAYHTETGETPDILLGFQTPAADYNLVIKGFDLTADDTVFISTDEAAGKVRIDAATDTTVAFDLQLERLDDAGAVVFSTGQDVPIGPTDVLYVSYASWAGNGQPLALEIDRGGNGSIDARLSLVDAGDTFIE